MKILLAVIVIALLFLTTEAWSTQRLISIGRKLATEAVPFERTIPDAQFRILVIGDSTAVGTGAKNNTNSTAGRLSQDFPNATIINKGVNGMRIAELREVLKTLSGEHYNLMLIHIGGNDIVRFTNFNKLEKDLRESLELAAKMSDHVLLLHGGDVGTAKLLPRGTRWVFSYRTREVRKIFLKIASETGASYVDIYAYHQASEDPYKKDPAHYYAADFFHPSDLGYENWYTVIRQNLATKQLLPPK